MRSEGQWCIITRARASSRPVAAAARSTTRATSAQAAPQTKRHSPAQASSQTLDTAQPARGGQLNPVNFEMWRCYQKQNTRYQN